MPLYEYRCRDCGHELEVLQKFSDRPLRKCGECSGRLEKLISRTSFHLKGGGWFDQGYSSGGSGSPSSKPPGDAKSTPTASNSTGSSSEKSSKKKSSPKSSGSASG